MYWLLSHSHFRIVQRLTSVQGSMNLPAGFPDSAVFIIKTWTSPLTPAFSISDQTIFLLLTSWSCAAFRLLSHEQRVAPPAFCLRSPMLPNVHICWVNQWCGGGYQKLWPFPLLHRLPMVSSHPIYQVLKVKRNSVQYTVCRGSREENSHIKLWVFSFNNKNL